MKKIFPLMIIVFLAAFLLFQIELIISKSILPTFGGSYLVWSVCVMFFQAILLLGYLYAHLVSRKFDMIRYFRLHLILLFLSLLFLPGVLLGLAPPEPQLPFVIEIVWLLGKSIGPLFLVLSTTSIIIQSWLASSDLPERSNPYILYGVSNLGSFAALLSYPFVVEPLFDLKTQLFIWRFGYLALVFLHLPVLLYRSKKKTAANVEYLASETPNRIPKRDLLRWFLLSSAACAMFLAVTNVITLDLAPVPFLWILPLSIYLLTFVLNFKRRPFYPLWIRERFYLAVPVGVFLFLMMIQNYKLPVVFLLSIHLVVLFLVCMVCHGELNQSKPSGPRNLTSFYLMIASGGLGGSILVSWIIPRLSNSLIEYLAGFLLVSLALSLRPERKPIARGSYCLALSVLPLIILWSIVLSIFGLSEDKILAIALGIPLAFIFYGLKEKPRVVFIALLLVTFTTPFIDYFQTDRSLVYRHRNFYGIYRVYDKEGKRTLRHGSTLHGRQYLDPARQREALAYYHVTTPSGELMSSSSFNFPAIGIIGLGTGSLSVYAKPGQSVDFFELDPDNEEIANKYFTYLKDCAGSVRLIFGDARLSLSKIEDKYYDLLVLDAFNSDSIPVHLLTVEAISEYRRCLKDDGIILLHISNRYLNLEPVLYANAQQLSLQALSKSNHDQVHPDAEASKWVVLTSNQEAALKLVEELDWVDLKLHPPKKTRPWTDRYSNLLSAISGSGPPEAGKLHEFKKCGHFNQK